MSARGRAIVLLLLSIVALAPAAARADGSSISAAQEALLDAAWKEVVAKSGIDPAKAKQKEVERLILDWSRHPDVREVFKNDDLQEAVINRRARAAAAAVREESLLARSVNAAFTNPRSVGVVERSGLVDLLALAVEGTNLVSADDTAVTLNLTAAARYRHQKWLSRLGGSVTFGAKLPEKEITGLTGLPDTGDLFDAIGWDVKFRAFGDRDIRARKWEDDLFYLGSINVAHKFGAGIPAFDSALKDAATRETNDLLGKIKHSWQGSLKFSGQHLSNETGMDKYSAVAMVDGGLGPMDVTLNASYSSIQDVDKASTVPYTLKEWKVAAGLTGTILKDKILPGRGTVVTLSGEGLFPNDGADVPIERKRTWRADLAAKFPVSDTLSVPVSLTWTNDPNNLANQKYAKGEIGVNYDFGALKTLLGKNDAKKETPEKPEPLGLEAQLAGTTVVAFTFSGKPPYALVATYAAGVPALTAQSTDGFAAFDLAKPAQCPTGIEVTSTDAKGRKGVPRKLAISAEEARKAWPEQCKKDG